MHSRHADQREAMYNLLLRLMTSNMSYVISTVRERVSSDQERTRNTLVL